MDERTTKIHAGLNLFVKYDDKIEAEPGEIIVQLLHQPNDADLKTLYELGWRWVIGSGKLIWSIKCQ